MKVRLAKTAGFCMGVRRAMEIALTQANRHDGPLYTFGPLIHNRQVMDLLESKGVLTVKDTEGLGEGRIIIRAHGIPPQQHRELKETGLQIIDATCPKVKRVQAIIQHYTRKGQTAVIVGDADHAEVVGLVGYARGPAFVIQGEDDVASLPPLEQPFVVAQTTQNEQSFARVVAALESRYPEVQVFETICDATQLRQEEVRAFKGQVDGVVVVGGFHSGNTRRLVEISQQEGMPTFHVETERDLDRESLSGMDEVGLTAGASTPQWMIQSVLKTIESIRGGQEIRLIHWRKKIIRFLILSNLLACAGVFSFAYAIDSLFLTAPGLFFPALASLYIFAMHVFNQFLDKGASAYNDPDRADFLNKHKRGLIVSGITAICVALVFTYHISGLAASLVLAGLSLMGVTYSIPLVPKKVRHRYSYSRIKDIPGSKSASEALAWVAVITLLPLFEKAPGSILVAVLMGMVVFGFGYARAIFFSMFQVQGDMVVGTESLPIALGEKRTLRLLKVLLSVPAVILTVSPLLELSGPMAYLLLIPLLALALCLQAYEKAWLQKGFALESLVEGSFILSGLLALLWNKAL